MKGIANGRQDRKRKAYRQHRPAGTDAECIGENASRRDNPWQYGYAVCDQRKEYRDWSECVHKEMTSHRMKRSVISLASQGLHSLAKELARATQYRGSPFISLGAKELPFQELLQGSEHDLPFVFGFLSCLVGRIFVLRQGNAGMLSLG